MNLDKGSILIEIMNFFARVFNWAKKVEAARRVEMGVGVGATLKKIETIGQYVPGFEKKIHEKPPVPLSPSTPISAEAEKKPSIEKEADKTTISVKKP